MEDLNREIRIKTPESSMIIEMRYKGRVAQLFVTFNNNAIYRYDEVPRAIIARLITADSVGKFFHAHIKNDFPNVKVREADALPASYHYLLWADNQVLAVLVSFTREDAEAYQRRKIPEIQERYKRASSVESNVYYPRISITEVSMVDLTKEEF